MKATLIVLSPALLLTVLGIIFVLIPVLLCPTLVVVVVVVVKFLPLLLDEVVT